MLLKTLSENNSPPTTSPNDRLLHNWDAFYIGKIVIPGLEDAPYIIPQLLGHIPTLQIKGSLLPYLLDPTNQPLAHDVDCKASFEKKQSFLKAKAKILETFPEATIENDYSKGGIHSCSIKIGCVELELSADPKACKETAPQPLCDYHHTSLFIKFTQELVMLPKGSYVPIFVPILDAMTKDMPLALSCILDKTAKPCREAIDIHRVMKVEASGYHVLDQGLHDDAYAKFTTELSLKGAAGGMSIIGKLTRKLLDDYGQDGHKSPAANPIIISLKRIITMMIAAKKLNPAYALIEDLEKLRSSLSQQLPGQKIQVLTAHNQTHVEDFCHDLDKILQAIRKPSDELEPLHQAFTLSQQLITLYRLHQFQDSGKTVSSTQILKATSPFLGKSKNRKSQVRNFLMAQKLMGDYELTHPPLLNILDYFEENSPLPFFSALKAGLEKEPERHNTSPSFLPILEPSPAEEAIVEVTLHEGVKLLPFVFKKCIAALKKSPGLEISDTLPVQKMLKIFEKQSDQISLETLLSLKKILSENKDTLENVYLTSKRVDKKRKKKKAHTIEVQTLSQYQAVFDKVGHKRLVGNLETLIKKRLKYPEFPQKVDILSNTIGLSAFKEKYETLQHYLTQLRLFKDYAFDPPTKEMQDAEAVLEHFHYKIKTSLHHLLATEDANDGINREEILCEMVANNHPHLWTFDPERWLDASRSKSFSMPVLKVVMAVRESRMHPSQDSNEHLLSCAKALKYSKKSLTNNRLNAAVYGWAFCHAPLTVRLDLSTFCCIKEPTRESWKDLMPQSYQELIYSEISPLNLIRVSEGPEHDELSFNVPLLHTESTPYHLVDYLDPVVSLSIDETKTILSGVKDPSPLLHTLRCAMSPEACDYFKDQFSGSNPAHKNMLIAFSRYKAMLPNINQTSSFISSTRKQRDQQISIEISQLPELVQPYSDNFLRACLLDFQKEYMPSMLLQLETEPAGRAYSKVQRLISIIEVVGKDGQSQTQKEALTFLPMLRLYTQQKDERFSQKLLEVLHGLKKEKKKSTAPQTTFHKFLFELTMLPLTHFISQWSDAPPSECVFLTTAKNTLYWRVVQKALAVLPPKLIAAHLETSTLYTEKDGKPTLVSINNMQLLQNIDSVYRTLNSRNRLFSSPTVLNVILTQLRCNQFSGSTNIYKKMVISHVLRSYPSAPSQAPELNLDALEPENRRYLIDLIAEAKPPLDIKDPKLGSCYVIWQMSYLALLSEFPHDISDEDIAKSADDYSDKFQTLHLHGNAAQQMVEAVSMAISDQRSKERKAPTEQADISRVLSVIWMDLCDVFHRPKLLQAKLRQLTWALDHVIHGQCPEQKEIITEQFIGLFLKSIYIDENDLETLAEINNFCTHFGTTLPERSLIKLPPTEALIEEIRTLKASVPKDLDKIIDLLKKISCCFPKLSKEDKVSFQVLLKERLAIPLLTHFQSWQPKKDLLIDKDTFLALDFQLCQLTQWLASGEAQLYTLPLRYKAGNCVQDQSLSHKQYLTLLPDEVPKTLYGSLREDLSEIHRDAYDSMLFDIGLPKQADLQADSTPSHPLSALGLPIIEIGLFKEMITSKSKLDGMPLDDFTTQYQKLLCTVSKQHNSKAAQATPPPSDAEEKLRSFQYLIKSSYPHLVATSGVDDGMDRLEVLTDLLSQNHPSLWKATPDFPVPDASADSDPFLPMLFRTITAIKEARTAWVDPTKDKALKDCVSEFTYLEEAPEKTAVQAATLAWALIYLPEEIGRTLTDFCCDPKTPWVKWMPAAYQHLLFSENSPFKLKASEPPNGSSDEGVEPREFSIPTLNPVVSLTIEQVKILQTKELPTLQVMKGVMDPEACEAFFSKLSESDKRHFAPYESAYQLFKQFFTEHGVRGTDTLPELEQPYRDNFISWAILKFQEENGVRLLEEKSGQTKPLLHRWKEALELLITHYATPPQSRVQEEAKLLLGMINLFKTSPTTPHLIQDTLLQLNTIQRWFDTGNDFSFHKGAIRIYMLVLNQCILTLSEDTEKQSCLYLNDAQNNAQNLLCKLALTQLNKPLIEVLLKHEHHTEEGDQHTSINVFQAIQLQRDIFMAMINGKPLFESIEKVNLTLDALAKEEAGPLKGIFERRVLVHFLMDLSRLSDVDKLDKNNQKVLAQLIIESRPTYPPSRKPMSTAFVIWQTCLNTFTKNKTFMQNVAMAQIVSSYLKDIQSAHAHGRSCQVIVRPIVEACLKKSSVVVTKVRSNLPAMLTAFWLDFCNLCDDIYQIPNKLTQIQRALDHFLSGNDAQVAHEIKTNFLPKVLETIPLHLIDVGSLSQVKLFFDHFETPFPPLKKRELASFETHLEKLIALSPKDPECMSKCCAILEEVNLFQAYLPINKKDRFIEFLQGEVHPSLLQFFLKINKHKPAPSITPDIGWQLDFQLCQLSKLFSKFHAQLYIVPLRAMLWYWMPDFSKRHLAYVTHIPQEIPSGLYARFEKTLNRGVKNSYKIMTELSQTASKPQLDEA